jgi:hypothetical protein
MVAQAQTALSHSLSSAGSPSSVNNRNRYTRPPLLARGRRREPSKSIESKKATACACCGADLGYSRRLERAGLRTNEKE